MHCFSNSQLKTSVTFAHMSLAKANHVAKPNINEQDSYGSASFSGRYCKIHDRPHARITFVQEESEELEALIQSITEAK